MNEVKSLPIIETAYRLAIQLNKAVVKFPRHQRGGLGRRIEEAGFNFLEALTAARYRNLGSKAGLLTQASNYLDNLRLSVRMSFDLGYLPNRGYEELSKVILDTFDHFIKDELGFDFYVRYADDMVFISKDKNELESILDKTKQFLEEKLGVFLNPRKTLLKTTADGLDFLGYRIFYYHLLLRKKNMKKVKKRLFNLARWYVKGDLKLLDIKSSLAGWLGYAGFANTYNFRRKLFADFTLRKHSLN